jgi:hypothetical protein
MENDYLISKALRDVSKMYSEYKVIDPGKPDELRSGIRGKLGMKKKYPAKYLLATDEQEPYVHQQAYNSYINAKKVKNFSRNVMKPSENRSY